MADFTIEIVGLDDYVKNIGEAGSQIGKVLEEALVKAINVIKNDAQLLAPFVTGTLRRSIYTDIQEMGTLGIVAQDPTIAPYGIAVEFGTRPHDIYPVNKKALYWSGALHPVRHVFHPGTNPQPFMLPAFQNNIDVVQQIFQDAVKQILQIAAGE